MEQHRTNPLQPCRGRSAGKEARRNRSFARRNAHHSRWSPSAGSAETQSGRNMTARAGSHGLRRRAEGIEANHQKLLTHLNPDKDSLLHFLRTNKPDWHADYRKVIREDVLTVSGLSPSIDDVAGSLYACRSNCRALTAISVQMRRCFRFRSRRVETNRKIAKASAKRERWSMQ